MWLRPPHFIHSLLHIPWEFPSIGLASPAREGEIAVVKALLFFFDRSILLVELFFEGEGCVWIYSQYDHTAVLVCGEGILRFSCPLCLLFLYFLLHACWRACLLAGLLAGGVCVLPSSRSTLAPPNPSSTKSPVSKPTPGHISCNTVSLDTLPDVIDR